MTLLSGSARRSVPGHAGRADNVDALEIVTYDGERFWVGVGEEQQSAGPHGASRARRARCGGRAGHAAGSPPPPVS